MDSQSLRWMTIVGVVKDVRQDALSSTPRPTLYMPLAQHPYRARNLQFILHTAGDPHSLQDAIERKAHSIDPAIAIRFTTMGRMVSDTTSDSRFRTALLDAFASIALLLAILGVYGVTSYTTAQRIPEIGIRMTLGATRGEIVSLFVRHALRPAAVGLALGLLLGVGFSRWISTMLYGVNAFDPMTYGLALAGTFAAVLLAAWAPARRAASVDPMQASVPKKEKDHGNSLQRSPLRARKLRSRPDYVDRGADTAAMPRRQYRHLQRDQRSLFPFSAHSQESRLVMLGFQQKGNPWRPNFSLPEYRDLRSQTQSVFSGLAAEQVGIDGLSMRFSRPDRIFTDYVTGNYFQVLGVQPLLGRFFLPSEGKTPGADPVMVLSYAYWKQHFAGDPNVIGRQVSLNGHPITVIGITPEDFHGIQTVLGIQGYLPQEMIVTIENVPLVLHEKRSSRSWQIYARLQPGVTTQEANATLAVVARRFSIQHPRTEKDAAVRSFSLIAGRIGFDPNNTIGVISSLFLSLAGLVLLLACVNVANLLLVRASVREREIVIRSALGAQRSRLIRQMLTESVLLALLGGAAGVALGLWGSSLLGPINMHTDVPIYFDFGFDWHVFAFSAVIAVLAGAIVGIVPAMRMSRANLNLILREGGRGVTGGSSRFRDGLVMLQVGSALTLLIIAGLFTRSLTQAAHSNFGFNPSHVLTLTMDPSEIGYNDEQSRDFYKALQERTRVLPGVVSSTVTANVPMSNVNNGGYDTLTIPGYQPPPGQAVAGAAENLITTEYFRTLQIPLVQGRSFTASDDENLSTSRL